MVFQVNSLYLKRICPQWDILLVGHPKVIPNPILDMVKKNPDFLISLVAMDGYVM